MNLCVLLFTFQALNRRRVISVMISTALLTMPMIVHALFLLHGNFQWVHKSKYLKSATDEELLCISKVLTFTQNVSRLSVRPSVRLRRSIRTMFNVLLFLPLTHLLIMNSWNIENCHVSDNNSLYLRCTTNPPLEIYGITFSCNNAKERIKGPASASIKSLHEVTGQI
jgi:hypothetical protein